MIRGNCFKPESLLLSCQVRLGSSNPVFMMFYLKCETLSNRGKRIVPGLKGCLCVSVSGVVLDEQAMFQWLMV